jgi:Trk K+ transport system NAD-binding subunit
MSRVLIIGGHGKVALLAAPLLVSDGHEVTSVVRNPEHVADVEATGATAAVFGV